MIDAQPPEEVPTEDESEHIAVGDDLDAMAAERGWLEPFSSLDQALREQAIPAENHDLIRRAVQYVGIERLYPLPSRSYIRAIRSDRKRTFMIAYGWSAGFVSEQEVLDAVGDVDRWRSNGGGWGITHPVNAIRDANGERRSREERDYEVCPNDFIALPATGICDMCGYQAAAASR